MVDKRQFIMQAARAVCEDGLGHISAQVAALERNIIENPSFAFDLAKTLIEDVCKAVLKERSVPFDPKDDLPKLLKSVCEQLRFLPPGASGESSVRDSLKKTLGGLKTAVQGVCELRNQCGFASHASGSPKPAMEAVQSFLAAQAADTIVGFIYRIHRQDRAVATASRLSYEENPNFNAYVDEQHDLVRIFELEFRPSEVLFQTDPEGYRNYLAQFEPVVNAEESEPEMTGARDGAR